LSKYSSRISDKFDKEYFLNQIQKITNFTQNQISQLVPKDKVISSPKQARPTRKQVKRDLLEYNIIGQMLSGKEAALYIRDNLGFLADDELNRLYLIILDYYYNNDVLIEADVVSKINQEDKQLAELFLDIVSNDNVIKDYDKKIIDQNIGLIEVRLIERNIRELRQLSTMDDNEQALRANKIAQLNLRKSEILEK
ncbi:MAG TPA: hypothetical protein VFC83_00920, partial [Erysipelotrichaceae bacterium]|nr:hypothetical protein [Erysipelotrichaceae bacterium]